MCGWVVNVEKDGTADLVRRKWTADKEMLAAVSATAAAARKEDLGDGKQWMRIIFVQSVYNFQMIWTKNEKYKHYNICSEKI